MASFVSPVGMRMLYQSGISLIEESHQLLSTYSHVYSTRNGSGTPKYVKNESDSCFRHTFRRKLPDVVSQLGASNQSVWKLDATLHHVFVGIGTSLFIWNYRHGGSSPLRRLFSSTILDIIIGQPMTGSFPSAIRRIIVVVTSLFVEILGVSLQYAKSGFSAINVPLCMDAITSPFDTMSHLPIQNKNILSKISTFPRSSEAANSYSGVVLSIETLQNCKVSNSKVFSRACINDDGQIFLWNQQGPVELHQLYYGYKSNYWCRIRSIKCFGAPERHLKTRSIQTVKCYPRGYIIVVDSACNIYLIRILQGEFHLSISPKKASHRTETGEDPVPWWSVSQRLTNWWKSNSRTSDRSAAIKKGSASIPLSDVNTFPCRIKWINSKVFCDHVLNHSASLYNPDSIKKRIRTNNAFGMCTTKEEETQLIELQPQSFEGISPECDGLAIASSMTWVDVQEDVFAKFRKKLTGSLQHCFVAFTVRNQLSITLVSSLGETVHIVWEIFNHGGFKTDMRFHVSSFYSSAQIVELQMRLSHNESEYTSTHFYSNGISVCTRTETCLPANSESTVWKIVVCAGEEVLTLLPDSDILRSQSGIFLDNPVMDIDEELVLVHGDPGCQSGFCVLRELEGDLPIWRARRTIMLLTNSSVIGIEVSSSWTGGRYSSPTDWLDCLNEFALFTSIANEYDLCQQGFLCASDVPRATHLVHLDGVIANPVWKQFPSNEVAKESDIHLPYAPWLLGFAAYLDSVFSAIWDSSVLTFNPLPCNIDGSAVDPVSLDRLLSNLQEQKASDRGYFFEIRVRWNSNLLRLIGCRLTQAYTLLANSHQKRPLCGVLCTLEPPWNRITFPITNIWRGASHPVVAVDSASENIICNVQRICMESLCDILRLSQQVVHLLLLLDELPLSDQQCLWNTLEEIAIEHEDEKHPLDALLNQPFWMYLCEIQSIGLLGLVTSALLSLDTHPKCENSVTQRIAAECPWLAKGIYLINLSPIKQSESRPISKTEKTVSQSEF